MAVGRTLDIQPLGFDAPIKKAARELAAYLPKVFRVRARALPPSGTPGARPAAHIVLGTSEHLQGLGIGSLPEVSDLDDALAIIPKDGRLYLAGSNPRSVLFAAYRLLEELGVVFLRPGPSGEVLPKRKPVAFPGKAIREKASYRHRGICIEGSPRLDHVLKLLDWMAKKRMNAFQLQFRHSGVFWRRGYCGEERVAQGQESTLSEEDCLALDDRVIAHVAELGMTLHRVGHGWTTYTLGLPGLSWEKSRRQPPKEKRRWLAQLDGRRGIFRQLPINTELCYSRADARKAFVEEVVGYAREHSEVDILHVWLSDYFNNKCECKGCRTKTPTDWYVMLINAIGRRFKEEGLSTRVLFLGYVDLLWPPAQERITEDNVVFMYAPITRCYRHALSDSRCDEGFDSSLPELNRCVLPKTNRAYAEIARAWKKTGMPDTFVFDYHMMWAVWGDGFGSDIGATMARDMKDLGSFGLNGLVSCQCTRAFYPLPYLPNVMADMLWDSKLNTSRHRRGVMTAAFGRHADLVEAYFAEMVSAFREGGEYGHAVISSASGVSKAKALRGIVSAAGKARREFQSLAGKEKDAARKLSLELVAVHAEHAGILARVHIAGIAKDKEGIAKLEARYKARLAGMLAKYSQWVDPLVELPVAGAIQSARDNLKTRNDAG